MNIFVSAIAAVFPISIYVFIIWYYDRFDREPVGLYLQNFLWGSLGAVALTIISGYAMSRVIALFIIDSNIKIKFEILLVSPVIEEFMKALFLFYLFSNRRFDNITDGLVYGGAIGLGFGMSENYLYFLLRSDTVSQWIHLVFIRSLGTATMHCVATASFGAFLGYTKINLKKMNRLFPVLGFCVALFIHFFWNYSVSINELSFSVYIFLFILIVIFITVFYISLQSERDMIFKQLTEESTTGIIPFAHASTLSKTDRQRKGWIAESIQDMYVESATSLAFRKVQLQSSDDKNKSFYQRDIQVKRIRINRLLHKACICHER